MSAELSAYGGPTQHRTRDGGPVAAALLTALGVLVAVWPLSAVVQPGSWSAGAATAAGSVIVAGAVARFLTRRSPVWLAIPAVPVVQLGAGLIALTVFVARQAGRGWLLPTPEAWRAIDAFLSAALGEIRGGVAPLASSPAIAVGVAVATGLIAVVLDLVLVTLRAPLVAAVLVTALGAVPGAIVHQGANPVWFIGLALAILLFLHVQFAPPGSARPVSARDASASRHARTDAPLRTRRLPAFTLGFLAVLAALIVSPLLPLSASGLNVGGGSSTLSATLNLGQDLRRPSPVTALTLISQDGTPPYLRIATLTRFDGSAWQPDRPATVPLAQGFGDVAAPEGVALHKTRITVRTAGISGSWLPVPYQATAVRGENGSWNAAVDNRTVIAANGDAAEQNYTIDTATLEPTLDQIRASTATGSDAPQDLRALPANMPAIIADSAREVVGGSATDYDKLIALQTWFRAGFRYSLQTPVDDGFDGTNVDAVAKFLTVREGYCVHFAGAFALMARSLGMPARIVVGYLPGTATDRRSDDGRVVFEVSTDQLHSWPEVYFAGIGWVPFEPTATRGVPTAFTESSSGSDNGTLPSAGATPQPTTSGIAKDPKNLDVPNAGATGASTPTALQAMPVVWTVLAVLVVLLIPALIRRVQAARRRASAGRGDAVAAWSELRATLQDLGLPASSAESPRARGARLVRDRGADPADMDVLVRAIERASYARSGSGSASDDVDLRPPLDAIRRRLREHASRRDRMAAVLAPRSLLGARLLAASTS
ncbi:MULTISPECIES: transglutaminaseTgpA domain-containing protein [unclassified Microbacterium]|uniref:transglutaminase family protein n=1 Tax=unclassified Microbacterium TaxID=2609290 RepID=UPI00365A1D49